jgi:hypothetical protein
MPIEILQAILILLATAVVIIGVFRRLQLSSILGYLVVGILLGPHSLGMLTNTEHIQLLAELGVVFLISSSRSKGFPGVPETKPSAPDETAQDYPSALVKGLQEEVMDMDRRSLKNTNHGTNTTPRLSTRYRVPAR